MPDPAEQLDVVPLELHPRATAEAEPTAGQLGADLLHGHGNARGQAFDHDHQGGAVRLPGSQVAQHRGVRLPAEARWTGPKPATRSRTRYLMTCSPSQRENGESPKRNWPQVPETATSL